jgi:hypothetical protein
MGTVTALAYVMRTALTPSGTTPASVTKRFDGSLKAAMRRLALTSAYSEPAL